MTRSYPGNRGTEYDEGKGAFEAIHCKNYHEPLQEMLLAS